MKTLRNSSIFILLFFFSRVNAQGGLTSLFFDFGGKQSVIVDTNGINGRTHLFTQNAKNQFAVGLKLMEMNTSRDLHFGFIACYRQLNMSNLKLYNQPADAKKHLFEFLLGGTYLRGKPIFQTEKTAVHFTLSGYAGFQGLAFGSNLSGGFMFLSKTGLAGLTFEFVYRPVSYEFPNDGHYYIQLEPSWALRAALTFGKNLQYE